MLDMLNNDGWIGVLHCSTDGLGGLMQNQDCDKNWNMPVSQVSCPSQEDEERIAMPPRKLTH